MKIIGVETHVIKIPPGQDSLVGTAGLHGTAAYLSAAATNEYQRVPPFRTVFPTGVYAFLVSVYSDTGLVGLGECQSPVVPEANQAIVEHLLAPMILGRDPIEREVLWNEMYDGMRDRGHFTGFMLDAISAIDIALWDLAARGARVPVHALLGGAVRKRVPCYISGLAGATIEARVESARRYASEGFRAFKLFLGQSVEADVAQVAALRAALGKDVALMVDVQWNYDVPTAIRLGGALAQYDITWLETPTNPEDLAGHAAICAALDVAVASGECERTRYQFLPWFEQRALDIAQPDVGRAGGLTESRRITALAETFNIPCTLHLGVGLAAYIAASLQLAAAMPNLLYLEYQPAMQALSNGLLEQPLRVENGHLLVPDAPGLGIALRKTAVEPYVASSRRIGDLPQISSRAGSD